MKRLTKKQIKYIENEIDDSWLCIHESEYELEIKKRKTRNIRYFMFHNLKPFVELMIDAFELSGTKLERTETGEIIIPGEWSGDPYIIKQIKKYEKNKGDKRW